ncbi:MAG: hypothetical protein H6747_01195 [Deltaproteobacteria bacterium]|nr:hypothetical protein [Deltaproteobacteria bacterium]
MQTLRQLPTARRLTLLAGTMAAIFGATQLLSFDLADGGALWRPALAYFSGGLNILLGVACWTFAWVNRIPGPDKAQRVAAARRFERSVSAIFVFTLAFCLTHLWLAGSHNSVVILTLLVHLLLVRWFAPAPAVRPLLTLSVVAATALVLAEYLRWIPYSPMLQDPRPLEAIFLDWHWVLGDALMFTAMGVPMVTTVGVLRERSEAREAELEAALERAVRGLVVGEISAAVVHQLSQPHAAILSHAQATERLLAGERPDLDEARAAAHDIVDEARRASEVVTAIRRLATDSSSPLAPLQLGEVVTQTCDRLQGRAAAHGVTLRVDAEAVTMLGDAALLTQLVLVLVHNALQAQQSQQERPAEGRAFVQVRVRGAGGGAVLEVADNGPGFADEVRSRALEPFVTLRPGGMGIGLALARRVAEVHGGSVEIADRPGGGALVRVRLAG